MQELSQRNRLSTVGGLLVYQPHAPQGDPIARDVNVQIDHEIRRSLGRATFDSPRRRQQLRAFAGDPHTTLPSITDILDATCQTELGPQHIMLELGTRRSSHGRFHALTGGNTTRPDLTIDLARKAFDELQSFGACDLVLTIAGDGDPLLHPHFDDFVQCARDSGIRGVHLRTDLLVDHSSLNRLLACRPDVISVNLNADRASTYKIMMGCDRFKDVLLNIEYLVERRERLTQHSANAAFALPWIVPHLLRCEETYEDIDTFFDRWQHTLGCAVIDGPATVTSGEGLAPAITPKQVLNRDAGRTLAVLCDGSVLLDSNDFACAKPAGNTHNNTLSEIWSRMRQLNQPQST
jgi:hypothetical protein